MKTLLFLLSLACAAAQTEISSCREFSYIEEFSGTFYTNVCRDYCLSNGHSYTLVRVLPTGDLRFLDLDSAPPPDPYWRDCQAVGLEVETHLFDLGAPAVLAAVSPPNVVEGVLKVRYIAFAGRRYRVEQSRDNAVWKPFLLPKQVAAALAGNDPFAPPEKTELRLVDLPVNRGPFYRIVQLP